MLGYVSLACFSAGEYFPLTSNDKFDFMPINKGDFYDGQNIGEWKYEL
jgi:hypothetical protein